MLLVGAGLLVRSLTTLLRVNRGFETTGVLVTTLQAWSYYPTPAQRAEFVRAAETRLAALPGVRMVGMTSSLPLDYPIGFQRPRVLVEGQSVAPSEELPSVLGAATSPSYFATRRFRSTLRIATSSKATSRVSTRAARAKRETSCKNCEHRSMARL